MEKLKPIRTWKESGGISICKIHYNGIDFYGEAFCHDDDEDMKNELTGGTIAEVRAFSEVLKWRRDNEILPALNALTECVNALKNTPNVPKRVNGIIYHRINKLENELADIRATLKFNKDYLSKYIKEKDEFYKKIRENRKGKIE